MDNKKVLNNIKNSPVETITIGFVEDAIKLTHSSFIRVRVAYRLVKKGWINLEAGNYTKSYKNFSNALKIFIKREDLQGTLLSRHGLASLYQSSKQYNNAIEIYYDLLNKINKNDVDLRFIILKDIAFTYYLWGSYALSIKYLKITMNIIKSEKSVYRKIYLNYFLGRAYNKLSKIDKAQESFFMALTLCDANGVNYKISETLTQLGNIFRKKQNMIRSESFHIRALQYAKSSNDYNSYIDVLINLGCLMFYSGDFKKCNQYIFSAIEELTQIPQNYKREIKAYHYLFLSFKELGEVEEALKYLQKSMVIKENEINRITIIQWELLHSGLNKHLQIDGSHSVFSTNNVLNNNLINIKSVENENFMELANALYIGVKNLIHFTNLSIYSYSDDMKVLNRTTITNSGRSKTEEITPIGTPAEITINQEREIIIYDGKTNNSDIEFNSNKLTKGMKSFIVLPIKRGESVIAALSIEDIDSNKYTQYELNTLKTISAYISLTIENLRIKDEIESLNSLVDSQNIIEKQSNKVSSDLKDLESGLPLKVLFVELLDQLLKGTKRDNGKIALFTIIIDFDFTNNGTFLSEDLIIGEHTIMERVKAILRSEDILGKEREDTYLLAIKIQSIRGCRVVASKLVEQVKSPIFTENQKIQPIIKIGISIYPDNYLTLEDLIENSKKSALKITKDNIIGYEFSESIHNITGID